MEIIKTIIMELDEIPDNEDKKRYLESELDKSIGDKRRMAIKIMLEDNFIDKYYKYSIIDKIISTIKSFFLK